MNEFSLHAYHFLNQDSQTQITAEVGQVTGEINIVSFQTMKIFSFYKYIMCYI